MFEIGEDNEHNATITTIADLLCTMKPVFLLENVVGIFRLSGKKSSQAREWLQKLYALVTIALYIGLYSAFLDLPTVIHGESSVVEAIDEIPSFVILIQYVMTSISANFLFNKLNVDIFNAIIKLDNTLLKPSSTEFYRRDRVKCIKYCILMTISHIVICVTDLSTEDEISVSVVIFLPLYFIQKLEILMFCLLIDKLRTRLVIINGFIAKFLVENNGDKISVFTVCEVKEVIKEKVNMIGRPSKDNIKIHDLASAYDTIGVINSLVNSMFNFQIFMTLVSTFSYIVVTIWTSLYLYKTPENNSGPLVTIAIWCLTTLMTVAVMCVVCERLQSVRNITKILVNQIIMDYDLPKTMRVQAKAFMELIEAWPLRIFIYDMFAVDITLMLKFISVSTTYLIVIIQISHFS